MSIGATYPLQAEVTAVSPFWPYIVLRNDRQDALGAGLAVTEYALDGKSADEIRGLRLWVWKKLKAGLAAHEQPLLPAAIESVVALA